MSTDTNDNDLFNNFSALVWAERFVQRVKDKPSIATDVSAILAWFAGAIMTGHDFADRRYEKMGSWPLPGDDSQHLILYGKVEEWAD